MICKLFQRVAKKGESIGLMMVDKMNNVLTVLSRVTYLHLEYYVI